MLVQFPNVVRAEEDLAVESQVGELHLVDRQLANILAHRRHYRGTFEKVSRRVRSRCFALPLFIAVKEGFHLQPLKAAPQKARQRYLPHVPLSQAWQDL